MNNHETDDPGPPGGRQRTEKTGNAPTACDAHRRLLAAITHAQERAIDAGSSHEIFAAMLLTVLDITESAFGFMGEVFSTPEGRPYLKTHALTNIAWNAETQVLYERHLAQGLEFRHLDNLFGAVMKTGRPVIANDPGRDPRRGGLPAGHPPLASFLGLPLHKGGRLVGMIGLANRPGGYDEQIIAFLEPLLSTCGTLITAFRNKEDHHRAENALRQALEETERERARADAIIAAIGDPLTIQDTGFRILYQNEANKKIVGDHEGKFCYQAYEQQTEVCAGCALAKAFADGRVHKGERSTSVNNRRMYFEITASPVLDRSGQVMAGIEIGRDITDRKQREELLAEQVRLLSLSSDIGAELTKARTAKDMLTSCCGLLVRDLDAAFARIWTVNDTGDMLELQASAGMYTHIDGPHGRIPVDDRSKIGSIGHRKAPHAPTR